MIPAVTQAEPRPYRTRAGTENFHWKRPAGAAPNRRAMSITRILTFIEKPCERIRRGSISWFEAGKLAA